MSAVNKVTCSNAEEHWKAEAKDKPPLTVPAIHTCVAACRSRMGFVCDVLRRRPDIAEEVKNRIVTEKKSLLVRPWYATLAELSCN